MTEDEVLEPQDCVVLRMCPYQAAVLWNVYTLVYTGGDKSLPYIAVLLLPVRSCLVWG